MKMFLLLLGVFLLGELSGVIHMALAAASGRGSRWDDALAEKRRREDDAEEDR